MKFPVHFIWGLCVRFCLGTVFFPHDAACAAGGNAERIAGLAAAYTVRIVSLDEDGEINGHGSGFAISKKGHIATNHHVIGEASNLLVVFAVENRVFLRRAEIAASSPAADLAILRINPLPHMRVARLADYELAGGQFVMSVGFPGILDSGTWATLDGVDMDGSGSGRIVNTDARSDFEPAVFSGAVAKNHSESGIRLILHDAKISGGNSGGPLLDQEGRVAGINTGIIPSSMAGADYPISIHISELTKLARLHSIPFTVTKSKPAAGTFRGAGALHYLLFALMALLAVVLLILALRKPRMIMVQAVSRVIGSPGRRMDARPPLSLAAAAPQRPAGSRLMRLGGRDPSGIIHHLEFGADHFQRAGGRLIIGRSRDLCNLAVPHDSVSRQHAVLLMDGGRVAVQDRNSGNGTRVNGLDVQPGSAPVPLRQGDRLQLGEVDLVFDQSGG